MFVKKKGLTFFFPQPHGSQCFEHGICLLFHLLIYITLRASTHL